MRLFCRHAFAATLLLALPAIASADAATDAALAEMHAGADKYRDVDAALADGYIRDPADHCFAADMMGMPPEMGAMGIHFFRPDLLAVTSTDPVVDGAGTYTDWSKPSIIIYEPQADGSLELVAVENLVFIKAWEAAGNGAPPVLLGRTWDTMIDDPATKADEAHGFAPHYDQHVWLYRENRAGLLEPFNAAVTCEHHHTAH
jgi:hypothetical protein